MSELPGLEKDVFRALVTLPSAQKVAFSASSFLFVFVLWLERYYLGVLSKETRSVHTEDDTRVTLSLLSQFTQVARLAFPSWRARESIGSAIFILLFAVKALLRVRVSHANGMVVGSLLRGNPATRSQRFFQNVLSRMGVGMAMALCSGFIEGLRPWLIGCYRERLSRLFQRRFYEHLVYYQASVLDNRLESVDTVIATYCGEFAEHFAELPYYFILPGFEAITSSYALCQQSGAVAPAIIACVVTAAVLALQRLSPEFGRIHSLLLSREDDFRRLLSNNLANVENIAMHDAGLFTRRRLDRSLSRFKRTLDHMALAKGNFETLEVAFSTFLTLTAHMVTFMTSRQSLFKRKVNDVYMEIQLIEDFNSSVKDFVINFRELSHLTEFTSKLSEFDNNLNSIASGTFITHTAQKPLQYTEIIYTSAGDFTKETIDLVKMTDVTLTSPIGDILFTEMSLAIDSKDDWVLVGENGCGKTSLLRMLTGLWLPSKGALTIHKSVRFLMAPQHSYMIPQCTLYEQLCFPQLPPPPTDEIIKKIEEAVELAGAQTVVKVIGGMTSPVMGFDPKNADESYDWSSLSGGQKQRISMARVFFAVLTMDRTKTIPIAVLDEATSMMDETEQDVLNNLRRLDVRMLSVTHREVVIRHHTKILKIKKGGKWSVEDVRGHVAIGENVVTQDETV